MLKRLALASVLFFSSNAAWSCTLPEALYAGPACDGSNGGWRYDDTRSRSVMGTTGEVLPRSCISGTLVFSKPSVDGDARLAVTGFDARAYSSCEAKGGTTEGLVWRLGTDPINQRETLAISSEEGRMLAFSVFLEVSDTGTSDLRGVVKRDEANVPGQIEIFFEWVPLDGR